MKKIIAMYIIVCSFAMSIQGQDIKKKLQLDAEAFRKWPTIAYPKLSPDGRFVVYGIKNSPAGKSSIIIKSIESGWSEVITTDLNQYWGIDIDNTVAVCQKSRDTAVVVELGGKKRYLSGYDDIKVAAGSVIASKPGELLIAKGTAHTVIKGVKGFLVVLDGKGVVVNQIDAKGQNSVQLITLADKNRRNLGYGHVEGQLIANEAENKVAWLSKDSEGSKANKVISVDLLRFEKSECINDDKSVSFDKIESYVDSDETLILNLKDTCSAAYVPSPVNLTVWNYKESVQQCQQKADIYPNTYAAAFNIGNSRLIRLQVGNEQILWPRRWKDCDQSVILGTPAGNCNFRETYWNPSCKKTIYSIDLASGKRRILNIEDTQLGELAPLISPDEKFVVYYDFKQGGYVSYDLKTDQKIGITASIDKILNAETVRLAEKGYLPPLKRGIAGWISKTSKVLIYDEYDIWEVSLNEPGQARCLTNEYGRKQGIRLTLPGYREGRLFVWEPGQQVILTAFSAKTKNNGFFRQKISTVQNPLKLLWDAHLYDLGYDLVGGGGGFTPIKAKNAEAYIVSRESVSEFPNLLFTKDFKSYTKISNINPEREYNWLSAELHTYTTSDGEELKGILYKPENFDASKKYPLIFGIYEQRSDGLHHYLKPDFLCSGCEINIPLMVASGYLVFSPDIGHYRPNETGQTALSAVHAALDQLKEFPFVDMDKIGLQGCSFGAYEANHIVTHSDRFKAVCSASGVSELMSFGNAHYEDIYTSFRYNQQRMVKFLWEDPKAFVDASPIYFVDRVKTPILFFHTTQDSGVPFDQGIQIYLSLRRLGKPSWLLEYGGSANHGVFEPEQQMDFSQRMLQFFNHYLKGEAMPLWMAEGVPARKAATESGLKLIPKT